MAILKFKRSEVAKIVEHSLANPEYAPSLTHLYEKKYWKPGVKPNEIGFVSADNVDTSKIEPHIHLVKDSGIYLMAATKETLKGEATLHFVVYAEGFGEDADWDDVRAAAGGDDFAENLPLSWFEDAILQEGEYIKLNLSPTNIFLIPEPAVAANKPKIG